MIFMRGRIFSAVCFSNFLPNACQSGTHELFLLWNFCSYDRKFLPSRCIFIRITLFGMIFMFLGKGRFIFCIFPQLFPVKCILTLTPGFSMRFPVTHFKFPGDNVPESPAKETAWSLRSRCNTYGQCKILTRTI